MGSDGDGGGDGGGGKLSYEIRKCQYWGMSGGGQAQGEGERRG